jgi:hypothetical protein
LFRSVCICVHSSPMSSRRSFRFWIGWRLCLTRFTGSERVCAPGGRRAVTREVPLRARQRVYGKDPRHGTLSH